MPSSKSQDVASAASPGGPTGDVTTTITATTHLTLPAKSTPMTYEELNPKSEPTEFFGPIGTTMITIVTPIIAYLLYYGCNEITGCPAIDQETWMVAASDMWPSIAGKWWDWKAAGVYLAWYMYTVACWAILPGEELQGSLLRDGTKKLYRFNGRSLSSLLCWPKAVEYAGETFADSRLLHPRSHTWIVGGNHTSTRWSGTLYIRVRSLGPPRVRFIRNECDSGGLCLCKQFLFGRAARSGW